MSPSKNKPSISEVKAYLQVINHNTFGYLLSNNPEMSQLIFI